MTQLSPFLRLMPHTSQQIPRSASGSSYGMPSWPSTVLISSNRNGVCGKVAVRKALFHKGNNVTVLFLFIVIFCVCLAAFVTPWREDSSNPPLHLLVPGSSLLERRTSHWSPAYTTGVWKTLLLKTKSLYLPLIQPLNLFIEPRHFQNCTSETHTMTLSILEKSFNTPQGHFEYRVMPFSLFSAPAVFQALGNNVLQDMLNKFDFVYLNDILIFSQNLTEHLQHVCPTSHAPFQSSFPQLFTSH